jgi:hypothetical protein
MPARDIYHDQVRNALIKDGWTITDDPYRLQFGPKDLYVDLGAERVIAAERGKELIAVEIKSFVGPSDVKDLRDALGQYVLYELVIEQSEPERNLYLAVTQTVYEDVFKEPLGGILLDNKRLKLVVFDPGEEEIVEWIQ